MSTPLQRRFSVTTLINDFTGSRQTLQTPCLLTTTALPGAVRALKLSLSTYASTLTGTAYTNELNWFKKLFSQDLRPREALIVHWDNSSSSTETLTDALDDAHDKGYHWYFISYIGAASTDITNQKNLAKYTQASDDRTICVLMTSDASAYDATSTTDIGKEVRDENYNRTAVIYHKTTAERPDACIVGRMCTTAPGAQQWDYKSLVGVKDGGLDADKQSKLLAKGYNFIETFSGTTFTHMYKGRSCTGRELRIIWGADWHDTGVESDIATFAFQSELMAFDNETFAAIESILRAWLNRALKRRIVIDDEKHPAVIDLPDPLSLPASTRTSGAVDLDNVYRYVLNSAIDNWTITGNWRITL